MKLISKLLPVILVLAALAATPASAGQGVSDDEIIIGSVNDLSGPFSAFGAPAVEAAQRHFDAVNAAGGIHGRTIRFIVEDHAYQMPKAIQGYNKLINRDEVFAMLLSLGTPMNIAGFNLMEPKNIPNLTPLSASRHMLDEPIRLRFSVSSSYYEQMRLATDYLVRTLGITRVCGMYIPSDFGKEMKEAAVDEAQANPALTYVTETSHKVDEADFVGSLQKLAAEECELIGLALSVRQVITVMATAKKLGLAHLKMIGTSGSFHTVIAKVPEGVTEGTVRHRRVGRSRGTGRRGGAGGLHREPHGGDRGVPRHRCAAGPHRRDKLHAGPGEGGPGPQRGELPRRGREPRLLRSAHGQPRLLRRRRPSGRGRHHPLSDRRRQLEGGRAPAIAHASRSVSRT